MARERFSRGDLYFLIAVLAVFGIVDAAYLTWQWYEAADRTWCDVSSYFSCTKVRESAWSAVAGIPTATVGLLGFAVLLALAILAFRGVDRIGPWGLDGWLILFASLGALVGFGLTLVEIFVIEAVCLLCVLGFVLDLGVLAVAIALVRGARGPEVGA